MRRTTKLWNRRNKMTKLLDTIVYCRLCQAVTNPDFNQFFTKARKVIKDVKLYYYTGSYYRATYYFYITKW